MDVKQKYQIVEKIIQTDDDVVLSEIRELLGLGEDFAGDLPPVVKQNILDAKGELDRGKGMSHEEVMKEARERFLK